MSSNYTAIIQNNLKQRYIDLPADMTDRIEARQTGDTFIFDAFGRECRISPDKVLLDGKELAFTVTPLPKIQLCYIIYEADEDFPASVTCLYSANASAFLPIDALADVGEYTSRRIMELVVAA
ncbi:MAG: DUF3786 domain-containing protein [Thermodesulfobacteriota bacterium]|nr:DUF3786 domain-containing protein [Thermodesulfobacteriota bacterium]